LQAPRRPRIDDPARFHAVASPQLHIRRPITDAVEDAPVVNTGNASRLLWKNSLIAAHSKSASTAGFACPGFGVQIMRKPIAFNRKPGQPAVPRIPLTGQYP